MSAFNRAEKLPKPKLGEMFTDVWATKTGDEIPAVIVSTVNLDLQKRFICFVESKNERSGAERD